MSLLKRLANDSFVYGLGGVIANGITFFLLPIYTRIFSPSEYGTIEMLVIISNFISYLLIFGMDTSQSFFFFKYKDKGKIVQGELVSAILQLRLLSGILIVLFATFCSPILNNLLFGGEIKQIYFFITFVGVLFNQVMAQSIDIMRLSFRPWAFLLTSTAKSLLAGGLILIFIFIFDLKILGYFLGITFSTLIVSIFGWLQIKEFWQFKKIQFEYFPRLLKFSAPLFLSGIFEYFIISGDRWFIQYFNGQEQLGIFAVGAKFSLLITLCIQIFSKAWWPIALDIMNSENAENVYKKISRLYCGISCVIIISISFLSPHIIKLFAGPDFYNAWPIIGILSWHAIFNGFANFISCIGLFKAEKTNLFLPIIFIITIIAFISNLIMVPLLGFTGAALATSFTYFIWMFIITKVSNNFWNISYEYKLLYMNLSIGILGTLLLTFFRDLFTEGLLIIITISLITFIIKNSTNKAEWIKGYNYCRNLLKR